MPLAVNNSPPLGAQIGSALPYSLYELHTIDDMHPKDISCQCKRVGLRAQRTSASAIDNR
jgi:hypothetical protein